MNEVDHIIELFTIRRSDNGKYLRNINGYYQLNTGWDWHKAHGWANKPAYMLRTVDGVRANLKKLCSVPYWSTKAPPGVCSAVAEGWKELLWRDFNPELLVNFEVVKYRANVLSQDVQSATEFYHVADLKGGDDATES